MNDEQQPVFKDLIQYFLGASDGSFSKLECLHKTMFLLNTRQQMEMILVFCLKKHK